LTHALLATALLAFAWLGVSSSSQAPIPEEPEGNGNERAWCAPAHDDDPDKDARKKSPAASACVDSKARRYAVTLHHAHTRELLPLETRPISRGNAQKPGSGVRMPPDERIEAFMRCRVTGDRHEMDPRLLPVAVRAAQHFDAARIVVVSAFRSPKFNELLRKKGHEVASTSRHMKGLALDFLVPEVRSPTVSKHLNATHDGGLGTYPDSDFVHVDFGRRRRWTGR